jgi:hypothetical protein
MAEQTQTPANSEKAVLNKRLETAAWGLFLIMVGGFYFIPETTIKKGFWSIGVGVIMLGLNAMRYTNHIRMSGFTTVLGVLSVIAGVLQLLGIMGFEGGALLIILGAYLILKPLFEQKKLFGKAEDS